MESKLQSQDGLSSFSLYNVAFTVEDLDKSINWYKEIFGFELISRTTFSLPSGSAEAALIKAGGLVLELLNVPNRKRIDALFAEVPKHLEPIGNKSIVLQVKNLAIATKELEEKGVVFVFKEQYLAGDAMFCTMIQDIDGNKINIFQTDSLPGS